MDHEQIIEKWPSVADFARDIGVKYQTARFMRLRNSIHPRHWRRVVEAAKSRGYRGITLSRLQAASAIFAEVAA